MKWSRRRLGLITLGFAAAGIPAWSDTGFASTSARIDPLFYPALARLALLYSNDACRRITAAVSSSVLFEFRCGVLARVERNVASTSAERRDADRSVLHALLMDDFRCARTVRAGGFRLAETEIALALVRSALSRT
jgi:hypothetical protein